VVLQQLSPERREEFIREMAEHWEKSNQSGVDRTVVDAEYLEVYVRPDSVKSQILRKRPVGCDYLAVRGDLR